MLGASAFFAFKVYEHIQLLQQDPQQEKDERALSSFDPQALLIRADEAFESGDMQTALLLYKEANAKEAQGSDSLFKMGYISQQLNNKEEALDYYKEAAKGDANNEYIQNSIASIYRANEEFVSAKLHLSASLNINDRNPVTYYNYGNLLVDMKHLDEAKEMYKKALEINPDFKEAKEELEKLD
jgi:tetratricopeptide (TPR) repeat protein